MTIDKITVKLKDLKIILYKDRKTAEIIYHTGIRMVRDGED